MKHTPVGISDLTLYVPNPVMELDSLIERRIAEEPKLERRLLRAIETTGQKSMRYPELWQDNATLSAQAAHTLLSRANRDSVSGLRYLAVGTETSVDHSKPIAAYVEGMLQGAGVPVPEQISTFQVQHACAGGTISMLSVGALLQVSGRSGESGVVICSDIARYDAPSTAEITQGAGAVAMLIETNPALIELDLQTQGYASRDVDDFFRPIGSVTAKVKGG
ncbi:MAG: hydroxymethylglutaryl-CoA synthase, partial [Spirochaetaceae bacterium]